MSNHKLDFSIIITTNISLITKHPKNISLITVNVTQTKEESQSTKH